MQSDVSRESTILRAALRLISERGFDAVGVDEIGDAAGISGPAIYRHFSSKEEILSTLFDQAMDRLLEFSGPRHSDPWIELKGLVGAQVKLVLQDIELVNVYAREDRSLTAESRRRLHRRQRQHVDRWVAALKRCFPECEVDQLTCAAHAAIGLILSVAHWPHPVRSTPDIGQLLEQMALGSLYSLSDSIDSSRRREDRGIQPVGKVADG